ncbi:MAG: PD-(D/E)XK nuclease family protein, partial [Bacteroidetes bacterium]
RLPPGLTRSGEADYLEARRRLFYVALTRARTHVVCCWAATDERGKPASPTRFVYEMEGDEPLPVEHPEFAPEEVVELQRRLMAPAGQPSVVVPDEDWLRARVQDLPPLSISAINQFLKCPLGFYYRYILGLPSMPSIEERWGTAMHEALRRYFEAFRLSANETWPPPSQLAQYFEAEMERLRGWFTPEDWPFYLRQGSHYLTTWLALRQPTLPRRFLVERTINGAIAEVAVTGTIDRIDLLGQGQARVVDYKLKHSNRWTSIHPPSDSNPFGTPLWRQLVFYQLLLEQDRRLGLQSEKATLDFLTPDDKGAFPRASHTTTEQEKEQMREIVTQVHARIQALDFLTGCGEPDCPWCHHARMNEADSLSDPELEMLL